MNVEKSSLPDIDELNQEFAIADKHQSLQFKRGEGGLPVIKINNQQASALVGLQGAYLLSWIPAGQTDVIWVSDDATFALGKSVRGGIPICWPWFGPHDDRSDFPAHGFARTVFWQVTDTSALASGETRIRFKLDTRTFGETIQEMWPYPTTAEYEMTIGKTLTLKLTTCNHSSQSFVISEALHTYFDVHDVTKTTITGLENKNYLDKMDGFKRKTQTGPIVIDAGVDRVYVQTVDEVVIDTQQRKIHISKEGSSSTVVWNPWQEIAEKMGDLGQDGYLSMLCVETANAADDAIAIHPGECHSIMLTYHVE